MGIPASILDLHTAQAGRACCLAAGVVFELPGICAPFLEEGGGRTCRPQLFIMWAAAQGAPVEEFSTLDST